MNHPSEDTPTKAQENRFFAERLASQLNGIPNFKDLDKKQREMYEELEQSAKRYFDAFLKLQGKGVEVVCKTSRKKDDMFSLQIFATPEIENAETRGKISIVICPEKTYLDNGMSISATCIMCGLDTSAAAALMRYIATASDMEELKDVLDTGKKHGNEPGGIGIYLLRASLGKIAIRVVMLRIIDDEERDMIEAHRGVVRNYKDTVREYYIVPFKEDNIAVLNGLVDFMFREKMESTWKIEEIAAPTKWQLSKALAERPDNPGQVLPL